MALVKRIQGAAQTAPVTPPKQKVSVILNRKLKAPSKKMQDYSWLIYGAKGIGKTSLAAKFPGAVFLNLEPGTKALKTADNAVTDWDSFVAFVDACVAEDDPDMTVVVDVVDLAYDYAYEKVCKQQKIESPTDENDFGATWKKIRRMFRDQVQRLINCKGGTVFLSHDTEKEIELRDGSKVDRVQPTMSKQALGEVEGIVDIVACYMYEEDTRVLRLNGSQTLVAKSRPEENFLTTSNEAVHSIPMGINASQAYKNVVLAFDNKQINQEAIPPKPPKVLVKTK
jgi:phage nucleotide-binding protein